MSQEVSEIINKQIIDNKNKFDSLYKKSLIQAGDDVCTKGSVEFWENWLSQIILLFSTFSIRPSSDSKVVIFVSSPKRLFIDISLLKDSLFVICLYRFNKPDMVFVSPMFMFNLFIAPTRVLYLLAKYHLSE